MLTDLLIFALMRATALSTLFTPRPSETAMALYDAPDRYNSKTRRSIGDNMPKTVSYSALTFSLPTRSTSGPSASQQSVSSSGEPER